MPAARRAQLASLWSSGYGEATEQNTYYDAATNSWDMQGLESDLQLCQAAKAAKSAADDEPQMF